MIEYAEQPTYRNVFGSCLCHNRNADGVQLPVEIPGYNGLVYLCAETVLDAAKAVRIGRARRAKRDKAAAKAKAERESV